MPMDAIPKQQKKNFLASQANVLWEKILQDKLLEEENCFFIKHMSPKRKV